MVYSSYIFILCFLPIVLLGYFTLSRMTNAIYQKCFLILASLFFYAYYNINYLPIIVCSIGINYLFAWIINKYHMTIGIVLGILFNIFFLGYFKYCNFFLENINVVLGTDFFVEKLVLPLGISFFTFQQLSFLVSIWKNEEKFDGFIDYCLFVTFFPQLVAGPIVLYHEMVPQFKQNNQRHFDLNNFNSGLYAFSIGLFKKAVIADTMSLFVENGFALKELGLTAAWITSLSYTFQIYFDFSGYSDMAIGIAKMFNIDIVENFNKPYKAESVRDFWRRWHMTLGRALSTYIYIPLGGNRKGEKRTYINLFITFLISGLWHGAAWTFIIWGILHGFFSIIERKFEKYIAKIPHLIRVTITFLIINFLWVLFRAESFTQAFNIYSGMINVQNVGIGQLQELTVDSLVNFPAIIDILYVIIITISLFLIIFVGKSSNEMRKGFEMNKKTAIMTGTLLCISLMFLSRGSVFIYFNF